MPAAAARSPIISATRRGRSHFAKRNVDAWSKELAKGPVDAIIVNASGCGTMVKDYGHLLKREPDYAARAARISDLAHDISEFVGKYELGAPKRWSSLRVAYHPACSLQHGQGIKDEPRELLVKAGYTRRRHSGIAHLLRLGRNLQHPAAGARRRAARSQDEEHQAHEAGRRRHRQHRLHHAARRQLDVPVVHTVELLDWAYGGPVPPGLEPLARFVSNVPEPKRRTEDFIHA